MWDQNPLVEGKRISTHIASEELTFPDSMSRDQVGGTLASRITSGFSFDTQSADLQCVRGSASRDAQPFRCAPGRPGYHSPNCGILHFWVCSARTKGKAVALGKRDRDGPSEGAVEDVAAQMCEKVVIPIVFNSFPVIVRF